MFVNKLEAFEPEPLLRLKILDPSAIVYPNTDDTEKEFGFKIRSKQGRFFETPNNGDIVGLLYVAGTGVPMSMTDSSVVCRLFGNVNKKVFTLWHISINNGNPLNDSNKGKRWGVHNIILDKSGAKTRWKTISGKNITPRNAGAHIRGTPNPYAAECLVRVSTRLNVTSVEQHSEMPCARLFNSEFDHRSHPATYTIYKALEFTNTMGNFVWYATENAPLEHSYLKMLQMMNHGISVI
jgi:hypothetical protein